MIPSPFPAIMWIVSVCQENTDRTRKKRSKKKNMDTTQTKLNAPHVRYNVKILPQ